MIEQEYTDNFYEVILEFFKENNIENGALFKYIITQGSFEYKIYNKNNMSPESRMTETLGKLYLEDEDSISFYILDDVTENGRNSTNIRTVIKPCSKLSHRICQIKKIIKYHNSKQLNIKLIQNYAYKSPEFSIYGI